MPQTTRWAGGFVLGSCRVPPAGAAQAEDLIAFRMGISAPSFTILPVHFADLGGFYAKNGLKVEIVNSEGGTRGISVLLSGELQAMHVGLAPAVQANLK